MWRGSCLKLEGVRLLLACSMAMGILSLSLTSCVTDNEANSKSISEYSDANVKSYGDLFQVFWNVMNQRYCDLNEQSGVSSLDWDQVYAKYKPKFDELKTFQHTSEFTQAEILADNDKAKQYFQEIVDNILDQHFFVKITLPVSHSSTETVIFSSTLHEKTEYFPLDYHWNYTKNQLDLNGKAFGDITSDGFCIMGGFLKNHPGIYYLGFNEFSLHKNCYHEYGKDYLPIYQESTYHLDQQKIVSKAQELIADSEQKGEAEKEAIAILANINSYLSSADVQDACQKMTAYSNQGDYYGLYAHADKAYQQAPSLIRLLPIQEETTDIDKKLSEQLSKEAKCDALNSASSFKTWFCQALANYLWHEREFYAFWSDLTFTEEHSAVEGYRRLFLEPLAKGDIQKLILDFRGNCGGSVIDTRMLTDYLVTQSATFCYVRKKEDNNPYSYTPWVPQRIAVTQKSLGRNIPTAILLDNYSASMSEMTTLVLKSQGDHVKTIGRNSYGAQSMLTQNNDASNGGWIGNVTSYLYFYMPFSLTRDAQGNLLEGVGITPDYQLSPMTAEEISDIANMTPGVEDRGFAKAIEVLQ